MLYKGFRRNEWELMRQQIGLPGDDQLFKGLSAEHGHIMAMRTCVSTYFIL